MGKVIRPPSCTCGNSGACGYCPRIAVTATKQATVRASGGNTAYMKAGQAAAGRLETRSTRR